ncbi:MAG TPA: ferredoxin--NADP reductase [Gammaproteobacteria bacterium]|nr:ferredoxin--NADP reductase [Gammaproteobacteria bacterium]
MTEWVTGEIVNRVDWTASLASITVRASLAPYKAGQFVRLGLDIGGERQGRPFSFVNAPRGDLHEFYFIKVDGGVFSGTLHAKRPGDALWVDRQPNGFFTLDEVPPGEILWLFATGTALGPFLSILQTPEPWRRFRSIVLCHAVRHAVELTYSQQIRELQRRHASQLIFIPFTSREHVPSAMSGRIPAAIANGQLEARAELKLEAATAQTMICGNPEMVMDTVEILKSRGLQKNLRRKPGQITVERYWDI